MKILSVILCLILGSILSGEAYAATINDAAITPSLPLTTDRVAIGRVGGTTPLRTTPPLLAKAGLDIFDTAYDDCSQDVSAALQAFMDAHDGRATLREGCYLINTALAATAGAGQFELTAFNNEKVTIQYPNTSPAISVTNSANVSSARTVSSITLVTDNTDDYISEIAVSSVPTEAVHGAYCAIYSDDMGIGQGTAPITAISKANPAVITLPGTVSTSDFANGNTVRIEYAQGMTELNSTTTAYTLANRNTTGTTTTFELSGVDSTSFGTYTGGGYIGGITSGSKHGFMGQVFQVMETETGKIRTYGQIRNPERYLTNANVRCFPEYKVKVAGDIHFEPFGDSTGAETTRNPAIKITTVAGIELKGLSFLAPWAQAIWIQNSAHAHVADITCDLGLNYPANNQYTYCVNLYGMNTDIVINDLNVHQFRHGVTTDGNSSATTATSWFNRGVPNNVKAFNVSCANVNGTCWDEHYEGWDISVDGLKSTHAAKGSNNASGTIKGAAIQSRSLNPTYMNIHVQGGSRGLAVSQTDHGEVNTITLTNYHMSDLGSAYSSGNKGQWTDFAVEVDDQTYSSQVTRVIATNGTLKNIGVGFYLNKNASLTSDGLFTYGVDEIGRLEGGANLFLKNQVWDYRSNPPRQGTSTSDYGLGFYMRGDANYGGSSVRVLDKPTIYLGTSQYAFYDVFEEHSSTGTPKNYYWPGAVFYNPSAVTLPTIVESGSTTILADTLTSTTDIPLSTTTLTATTEMRGGQYCDENGSNCFESTAVTGFNTQPTLIIPFNGRADSSLSETNAPVAGQFYPANSKRAVQRVDLTNFTQCRLVSNVTACTTCDTEKLKAFYKTSFTYATDAITDFSNLGTSEISIAATTAGVIASSWTDLAAGAKADVFVTLASGYGGDSTNVIGTGATSLQCR